jgi:hypothetical protein
VLTLSLEQRDVLTSEIAQQLLCKRIDPIDGTVAEGRGNSQQIDIRAAQQIKQGQSVINLLIRLPHHVIAIENHTFCHWSLLEPDHEGLAAQPTIRDGRSLPLCREHGHSRVAWLPFIVPRAAALCRRPPTSSSCVQA